MSDRAVPTTTTRRARREAERRAARAAPSKRTGGRSPIFWITVAALFVGIIAIAGLVYVSQSTDSLGLVPPSDPTPGELAEGRAVGRADAPATLDVWADFQCPSCGLFATAVEPRLIREYVASGKLRIVYHDFAFIGPESTAAAVAARAADAQGKFRAYHDWLYANQSGENKGAFRREVLVGIARKLGLDMNAFEKALDDSTLADQIAAETAEGSSIGVRSTPSLVLGGKLIAGVPAWDELAAEVEAAISGTPGASPTP